MGEFPQIFIGSISPIIFMVSPIWLRPVEEVGGIEWPIYLWCMDTLLSLINVKTAGNELWFCYLFIFHE